MFESLDQKTSRSSLRWTFWAGMCIVAGILSLLIVVPKLFPAEIPKEMMARVASHLPPVPTGNPTPPHVKVVEVKRELGPPRKTFIPPVFTEPRQVPQGHPVVFDEPSGPPALQSGPQDGPVCVGCLPGPVCIGCMGTDTRAVLPPPPPPPAPKPKAEAPKEEPVVRIRRGGEVQQAMLVRQIKPLYPPLAKQARIQGVVRLGAVIGKDGNIQNLSVISGHPLLVSAAVDAVKQWVYRPTQLNGDAVEVVTQIDVVFTLSQ